MQTVHIEGINKGEVILYTLSTCSWCRRTKRLLDDLGVCYDYIDLDLLEGEAKEEAIAQLQQWNPDRSFPTIVVNNQRSII